MRRTTTSIFLLLLSFIVFALSGCGGGGGGGGGAATTPTASALTSVGWYFENNAPDFNGGITCSLVATLYYDPALATSEINGFTVTAPNGARWSSAASSSQFGTNSSGKPYISRRLVYGSNQKAFPLGGTWTFELALKDGTSFTMQKTLHEPGTASDATRTYLYTSDDWTPSDTSEYAAALRRFPSEGYLVEYSSANGGKIATRGLAAVRAAYLAAEPRAYNMYCLLYDASNTYLGRSIPQYSQVDHSATGIIASDGELSLVPSATVASSGTVDLSQVKYIRFVYTDGAQFAPSSYSVIDYHSVSSRVAVQGSGVLVGGSVRGTELSLTGTVTTLAGGNPGTADGTGSAASFVSPFGITTDGTNLFVADNINHTIRVVSINTGAVRTIAGSAGTFGTADGTGSAARFHDPLGITTDGSNLYVADYVNNTIRKVAIATGAVTTLAGSAGSVGSADGGAAARFNGPAGLTTDGANLYVADALNNTIRKVVIATGEVSTIAGAAGQQGTADGTGSAARFYWPSGITIQGAYLYVTDRGNATIRRIEIATGIVTTVAGTTGVHLSVDGIGSAAMLRNPNGITTDGTNLYVTDYLDNVIRKIVISSREVSTIAGAAGSTGSADGVGGAASFKNPTDITTDGKSLYVVDSENNRIRVIK